MIGLPKKGVVFMPFNERKIIIENLEAVDKVIDFPDDDIGSCINGLKKLKKYIQMMKLFFAMVVMGIRIIFLKCLSLVSNLNLE